MTYPVYDGGGFTIPAGHPDYLGSQLYKGAVLTDAYNHPIPGADPLYLETYFHDFGAGDYTFVFLDGGSNPDTLSAIVDSDANLVWTNGTGYWAPPPPAPTNPTLSIAGPVVTVTAPSVTGLTVRGARETPAVVTPGFAWEVIDPLEDDLTWKDASGNFGHLNCDQTMVAAPVGDGLIPGNTALGSQALIADLSAPWWISCWRTITAGTIDSDDTVFGITLDEADGTVFDSYLAVLASGNQFQFFTAGGGNSGVFTIAAAGEHLFGIRVYLSGPTLTGQLYVDGVAKGTPFTITLGSGGPEGCTFANGLAGSGDNPLLYSIWGGQGTAPDFALVYAAGPKTYAHRNVVIQQTSNAVLDFTGKASLGDTVRVTLDNGLENTGTTEVLANPPSTYDETLDSGGAMFCPMC